MNICLVAATAAEVPHFARQIPEYNGHLAPGSYQISAYKVHHLTLLITGAGIAHSTYYITELLSKKQFDLCIQAGICGAFNPILQIGEVVEITAEKFAQTGAENGDGFLDIIELGLQNKDEFPYKNGWLENAAKPLHCLHKIQKVKAITVDTVHGNDETIARTIIKYDPDVESMEGAAFFYCCSMKKVPFLQIRSISNYVEKRNKVNWNIPIAVESLNVFIVQLFNELTT